MAAERAVADRDGDGYDQLPLAGRSAAGAHLGRAVRPAPGRRRRAPSRSGGTFSSTGSTTPTVVSDSTTADVIVASGLAPGPAAVRDPAPQRDGAAMCGSDGRGGERRPHPVAPAHQDLHQPPIAPGDPGPRRLPGAHRRSTRWDTAWESSSIRLTPLISCTSTPPSRCRASGIARRPRCCTTSRRRSKPSSP